MNDPVDTFGGWQRRVAMVLAFLPVLTLGATTFADGPRDNEDREVRPIPPPGIEVPAQDRQALEDGLSELGGLIDGLARQDSPAARRYLPDVLVFHRAVDSTLRNGEFYTPSEIQVALELLETGKQRARQLRAGQTPWIEQTGLVVRGFRSRLDDSVQPYGLVVPESYRTEGAASFRLDLWFHGRGEKLNEVSFIDQRRKQVGQYSPQDTFVLHPYGRYSNAFKFAGEVDVLESLAAVQRDYRIDSNRISVRGFSMGGAACWQFAVHFADRWFAANPGAGFAETPEFLRFFQQENLHPSWYEQKLWRWYDCPGYAANLNHCPTVAYSGENDIQKQAADVMERALRQLDVQLVHVIGPQTAHSIHPDSKQEIEHRMTSLAEVGRHRMPKRIRLVTYTLKYNRMHWLTINGLEEHWEQGSVYARITPAGEIILSTANVTDLTLEFPPGTVPDELTIVGRPRVTVTSPGLSREASHAVDGVPPLASDRSWNCRLHLAGQRWRTGPPEETGLQKRHDLQGPIDDAFMDSFVFVRPTANSPHQLVQKWSESELQHAVEHWRRHFRGDSRVVDDTALDDATIRDANLILFGDPASNAVLARIANQLPVRFLADEIKIGSQTFERAHHAAILVYPNPLNPQRYVVLNSGFTFREYDYLNNARQTPKLPDWAIVDLRSSPTSRGPGKVVAANFFDEQWRVK